MKYEKIRREIAATCIDMNRRGINQGTSGNISVPGEGRFPADALRHRL